MFIIGLTGGIGTGKTEVSEILQSLGAEIIDADLLGHEVYRPNSEGWRETIKTFGEDVVATSGEIDRKKLGAIVFSDANALERLNAITHPRIYRMIEERIQRLAEEGKDAAIVEAALLIEAGWKPLVNEVWVTTSTEDQAMRRVQGRNKLSEKAVRSRIRSQMPQSERTKHADVIIDNSNSLEELRGHVEQLWYSRFAAYRKESKRQT